MFVFFFNDTATTEIYTLSLHDALPICKELRVQMEELVKYIDKRFGTDFVQEFQDGQLIKDDGSIGDGAVDGVSGQSGFVQTIKQALASLGITIEKGVATVKEIVTDKLTAKTVRVNKIEMVDAVTGDIYCTLIENGEMKKVKAKCDQVEYLNGQMTIIGENMVSKYCDADNLNLCTDQNLREGAGLHWYGDKCHAEVEAPADTSGSSQAICDSNNLNLCDNDADCSTAGGHWYNNSCNAEAEAAPAVCKDGATKQCGTTDVGACQYGRSEERRVGKECRSRWSPYH